MRGASMSRYWPATASVLTVLLAACGGSNDDGSMGASMAPARGSLIESPPARVASFTTSDLFSMLSSGAVTQQALELITSPKCGIDVHQLRYNTVDATNQPTTASGALMVPTGNDAACQGPRPILVYAHGTQVERSYNIADLTDSRNAEGLIMALVFVAQGYIVVAPNYAGFDSSTLTYHPYLNGDQQSKDTADALTAARSSLPTSFVPSATDSGKLFITGYSQGGYVAMATHRLLQQAGTAVTAVAPMSGPYAMLAMSDAIFYGDVIGGAPLFVTYTLTGYQHAYGNLYSNPTDIFEARYATGIDSLLPTSGTRSELYAQGKLPQEQLFSSTPPDPAMAPFTPPTTGSLAPVFARGFGPDHLLTNPARLAYFQDAQAHPDGGFPNTTDGAPAAMPANPLRQALKTNDLRNWTPTSPVLLCAGDGDPTVLYMNTQLISGYWTTQGVTAPVKVLDVDGSVSIGDPDAGLKLGFDAAKAAVAAAAVAGGATDGGYAAVAEAYHGQLVPPFCLAAVRSFFNGH
jgi:hypothetical protein